MFSYHRPPEVGLEFCFNGGEGGCGTAVSWRMEVHGKHLGVGQHPLPLMNPRPRKPLKGGNLHQNYLIWHPENHHLLPVIF